MQKLQIFEKRPAPDHDEKHFGSRSIVFGLLQRGQNSFKKVRAPLALCAIFQTVNAAPDFEKVGKHQNCAAVLFNILKQTFFLEWKTPSWPLQIAFERRVASMILPLI